jgi:tyrosyl-tRNA synthetase
MNLMDMLERANIVENFEVVTKMIEEGGLTLNYKKVTNPLEEIVAGGHILSNNLTFLRIGKSIKW